MRKLILQMQCSLDGFVAGLNGELDWMTWDWDSKLKEYVTELTDSVGSILLGRKMAAGFISHWSNVVKDPDNPEYDFAKKMVDYPKFVFSKTLKKQDWINTTLTGNNLVENVVQIKQQAEKDIIVYGGASFVSALIQENLIDEYFMFINPTALGKGLPVFKSKKNLKIVNSNAFACGIVVNQYQLFQKEGDNP